MVNIGRSGMWRPAVEPWVERVAAALAERGKSTHSVFVEVEGLRVLVTPLEQQLALALGDDDGALFARKHILVRDCLGLRVKMACALACLENEKGEQSRALLEGLSSDVDLGCELMHELTLEMKDISSAGSLNEAKELSQYRKQLLLLVEQAERRAHGAESGGSAGPPVTAPNGGARPGGRATDRIPPTTPRPTAGGGPKRWRLWVALAALAVLAAAALTVTLYLGG